jgi:hypothetical protein
MHPVQRPDQLYQQAQQRAHAAGFQSVDEYVAEIVESDVSAAAEDFDHFFTPEIVSELDQIRSEVQAGAKTYSSEEVDEFFRQKSQTWRETHGN